MEPSDLVLQQQPDGTFFYCRSHSTNLLRLANQITKSYPSKIPRETLITPSGMAAISIVANVLLKEHMKHQVNLIYAQELYCDSPRLFKYLKSIYNMGLYTFDYADPSSLNTVFDSPEVRGCVNILFFEAASNPSGNIFDYSLIKKLRHVSRKLYVVVDNTWLTHVIFNPFDHDVDVVVTSLTKYYSAGRCIAGAIITSSKLYRKFLDYIRFNGFHVSPIHCDMIYKAMENMEDRIIAASKIATEVARFLSEKEEFAVRHASLPDDPSHERAKEMYRCKGHETLYPPIIAFVVPMPKQQAIEWMRSKEIPYLTSYGSAESRFDPWPVEHDGKTRCRLSIGYEDKSERLIKELV